MAFKKGNKFGKGAKPLDPDLKGARLLNQREVEKLLNEFHEMSTEEVERYSMDKKNPIGRLLIARIFIEAVRSGDEKKLDFIYTRLLGKPKETINHNVNQQNYHHVIMEMVRDAEKERDVTPKQIEYEENDDEENEE
jgi:hypothetical protein